MPSSSMNPRRHTIAYKPGRHGCPRRGATLGNARLAFALPQHPDEYRPKCQVLLAVGQQLGEGPALRVGPGLADPVGPFEVGSIRTRSSARGAGPSGSSRPWSRRSSSSELRSRRLPAETGLRIRSLVGPSRWWGGRHEDERGLTRPGASRSPLGTADRPK
jgi:hypothetical protein